MSGTRLRDLIEVSHDDVDRAFAAGADAGAHKPSLAGFSASVGADQLNRALDVDAFEFLGTGIAKLISLRDCTDRTKHPADETIVISLGSTEVTSTTYPILDISLGGTKLLDLKFTLDLAAEFRTLQLTVRDARIWSLKPGVASVVAKLKYGDLKLKEQRTPEWKIPGEIPFPKGLVISSRG